MGPPVPSGAALLLDIWWGAGRTRPAQAFSLFLAIWMLGWAFGGRFAVYTIPYVLGGSEIVAAKPDGLTCRTEVFALGLSRSYLAAEMRDLRFQPEVGAGKAAEHPGSPSIMAPRRSASGKTSEKPKLQS